MFHRLREFSQIDPLRKVLWILTAVVVASMALPLLFEGWRVVHGNNFHAVIPGRIYRSAQLDADELEHAIRTKGIRTVINLRGVCPQFDWYQEEVATLERLQVPRFDANFSSYILPGTTELRALEKALSCCEFPVLIHCRRGSDRTGLASALALLMCSDATVAEARNEFSLRYGHVQVSRTGRLHQVLDMYETWLDREGRIHRPALLREWIREHYRPGPLWAGIEPLEVPDRMSTGHPARARFRVHNLSEYPWDFRQASNVGIHLRYLFRNMEQDLAYCGGAGYFDRTLYPGECLDLDVALPAVERAGKFFLLVDLADEQLCWFSMVGSRPLIKVIEVSDDRPLEGRRTARFSGERP